KADTHQPPQNTIKDAFKHVDIHLSFFYAYIILSYPLFSIILTEALTKKDGLAGARPCQSMVRTYVLSLYAGRNAALGLARRSVNAAVHLPAVRQHARRQRARGGRLLLI